MIKKIPIVSLAILSMIMSGCSQTIIKNNDDYLLGQDDQYYMVRTNIMSGSLAESENGYYFLSGPNNWFMYYMDKQSMKPVILCNKPQCLHANETDGTKIKNCNAFFSGANIYYYDKHLYILYSNTEPDSKVYVSLYQVSLDGTERKKIYDFRHVIQRLIFHRGYIYYNIDEIDDCIENDEMNIPSLSKLKVMRLDINNLHNQPEIIYESSGIHSRTVQINAYGNNVYFVTLKFSDASLSTQCSELYTYNIATIKTKKVVDNILGFSFHKDKMIYSDNDGTIKSCNLDGTNTVLIKDNAGYIYGAGDDYIYVNDDTNCLSLYDWSGNHIKQLDQLHISTVYGGKDFFCMENEQEENQYGSIHSLYLLSKQNKMIKPKKLFEFIPVEKFPGLIEKN